MEHFRAVCRYVERGCASRRLVKRSEDWRWGSLWRSLVAKTRTRAEATIAVADSASAKLGRANDPLSQPVLDAVRR
ncbi:hypothetical protein [Bythopirellula polymerisocia]|uniref:hypothetical protein n=1 Tax=Bythopirellula polymerisocia TaxID=2528003 RepID=UPI0011B790B8|nr:hypothetical protein [Bythopirellula polymerisocia]